jgi:ABC-2 type transport system ATP-binding protein
VAAAARAAGAREHIPGVLERVGLSARSEDKVHTYSMGMRQRLGLARCLLSDPQLLILDEPTNGLDPGGMQEFRGLVREFVEEEGRTVFISSHLLDEVQKMCDAVAIVDCGRVIEQGAVADLVNADDAVVVIGVDRPQVALGVLRGMLGTGDVYLLGGELHVAVSDRAHAAAINRVLVDAGLHVWRLARAESSLEERFLALTSRLEEAA